MARLGGIIGALALAVLLTIAVQPARAASTPVTIMNFSFQPGTVTVPVGSTVTWTNQDSVSHTTTSDNNLWDSGSLSPGQSFSFTFSQPGTYTYHCAIHPYMTGAIVVQSATATNPPASTATPVPTATSASVPTATLAPSATPSPVPPAPTSTPVPAHHRPQKTVQARLKGTQYLFSPGTVRIKKGTKIVWKNPSGALHTVTSKSKGWKFDKRLRPGHTLSVIFKKTGTYHYYCKLHPYMHGTIVVR